MQHTCSYRVGLRSGLMPRLLEGSTTPMEWICLSLVGFPGSQLTPLRGVASREDMRVASAAGAAAVYSWRAPLLRGPASRDECLRDLAWWPVSAASFPEWAGLGVERIKGMVAAAALPLTVLRLSF